MVVRPSALQCGGDKNAPQALFKPICVQYGFRFFVTEKSKSVSSAAGRPGFQGAALNRFCILLSAQKDAPAGQAYQLKLFIRPSPPEVIADFFTNAPPVAVQIILFYKAFPAEGDCKLFHEYPPAGACKSFFPRRHMTSGAVIFSIPRVFSSTVAVARHRAARAAQTAESSHFTRQFW